MIEYESGRRVLFEEPAEGTPTVSVPPETKYTPQTQGNTGNTPPQPVYTQPPVTQYPYASSDWKTLMQLKAPEIYRQYQKKARMAKAGWWIAGAGALVVVVGAATGEKETVTNGMSVQVRLNGTGGAVAAAGSLVAITGVTVAIIGTTKRNRIKNDFISQSSRYTQKSPLQSPHFEIRTNGLAFVF
jgi:hypothetical protein